MEVRCGERDLTSTARLPEIRNPGGTGMYRVYECAALAL